MRRNPRLAAAFLAAVVGAGPALAQRAPAASADIFRQAIETYHGLGWDPEGVTCVRVRYEPERFVGAADARFAWTPVSFAAHLDAKSRRSNDRIQGQFELLARHGFLEPLSPLGEAPRYGLTWKGFVAAGEDGCFRIAAAEREVKVVSFELARVQRKREVFRVVATSVPRSIEEWTRDPDFAALFPEAVGRMQGHPSPVTYELARTDYGFMVITEPGRLARAPLPPGPLRARRAPAPAIPDVLREAGALDEKRVLELVVEHAATPEVPSRLCLNLPTDTVDETNFFEQTRDRDQPPTEALHFTVYDADRLVDDHDARRAYEFFRRLEAGGLAQSSSRTAVQFKGYAARGAVSFGLTPAAMALLEPGNLRCLRVGELAVREVLWFEGFTAANLRPRFIARTAFTPAPAAAGLVAQMAQLRRLAEVGGVARGGFAVHRDITVELVYDTPEFFPDVAAVKILATP